MPTHIALIRGINVGGRNMLAMADLKILLQKLGFTAVKSLLQSGNLIFQSSGKTSTDLERTLELETEKRFGISADYIIRTADEWASVVSANLFPKKAQSDPSHLVVMFFKSTLSAKAVQSLRLAIKGPEIIHANGRHLYIVYPIGIGKSKLTNSLIEKTLASRGTARNWNTVRKLAALTQE